MAITERMRKILKARDPYCYHCGYDTELVVHHRKNRKMGGSKNLDHFSNLMLVCADYNMDMESMEVAAQDARDYGHKLSSWEDFSDPVFDRCTGLWYQLNDDGTKTIVDPPAELF